MAWCDHIVTQPIMNEENADFQVHLRERFSGKITFMPYIWVDGLYSLCSKGPERNEGLAAIIGEEIVRESIQSQGLGRTMKNFETGALGMKHRHRFERCLAELERREAFCDVTVSGFLREHYRDQPLMITHNHPHPVLVNEIARQISERLGLAHKDIGPGAPRPYAAITLPEFGKVLSPYGVEELGLKYPYDIQWLRSGKNLIRQIARATGALDDNGARIKRRENRRKRMELASA
jgi:hypothetical protein